MTMTDDFEATILLKKYNSITEQIGKIDEKLDSLDPVAAGRTVVKNNLINEFESDWGVLLNSADDHQGLLDTLEAMDTRKQVAIYLAIVNRLGKKFRKKSDDFIEAAVKELPKVDVPTYTNDEVVAMTKTRSDLYKKAKMMRDTVLLLADDDEDRENLESQFVEPKKRTGSRGKRGARQINLYNWSINGEELTGNNNKLGYIASQYGYTNVTALKNKIQEALTDEEGKPLKDLSDPPKEFTFTLPNNDILSGVRYADAGTAAPTDSSDDSDDDDDDDDEDTGDDE